MSIEQNQQLLTEINSHNSDCNEAAKLVFQYTEMCKRGEVSKEEFVELIEDIQRQMNIRASMVELENLQRLNTAINGLINIAKMV
jgi:hypothetical protein